MIGMNLCLLKTRRASWFGPVTAIVVLALCRTTAFTQITPLPGVATKQYSATVDLPAGWKIVSMGMDSRGAQGVDTLILSATKDGATATITITHYPWTGGHISAEQAGVFDTGEKNVLTQMMTAQGFQASGDESKPQAQVDAAGRFHCTHQLKAVNGTNATKQFGFTYVREISGGVLTVYRLFIITDGADVPAENANITASFAVADQKLVQKMPPGQDQPPVALAQQPSAPPNTPAQPPEGHVAPIAPAPLVAQQTPPPQPGGFQRPFPPRSQPQPQPQSPGTMEEVAGAVQNFLHAAPNSPQTTQLVQDYHTALMMVEGNKGVGSAFMCTMGDHTYVMTNAHVLSDNQGVKITSLDNTQVTTGTSGMAVGRDIIRLEVAKGPKAFEVMTDVDSNVKIGDAVAVLGNAEGARVVHPVEGKIVGIGPDLIEVDAPFVPGNSGSPIIHLPTGKVIGIATYLTVRKVRVGTSVVTVAERRFGYRMDNVKQWETVSWPFFFAQCTQVAAITEQSEDFVTLLIALDKAMSAPPAQRYAQGYGPQPRQQESGSMLDENDYKTQGIRQAVKDLNAAIAQNHGRVGMSNEDQVRALDRFFGQLRSVARNDIVTFNARPAYDYFRREVEEQAGFRQELVDAFTKAMQNASKR